MQVRPCPLCAADDPRFVLNQEGWDLCQCGACGMVYLPKVPTYSQQIAEFDWGESFKAESERRDRERPVDRTLSKMIKLIKPSASAVKLYRVLRHASSGSLVDFGCDTGKFLKAASRHFKVTGVEISPELAAKAARRLPEADIICKPAAEADLPAGGFDVVTMFSYLEHEHYPLRALELARDALSPGGVLIAKCPNYSSINRRVRGKNWCGFRFPDHCNYYTPETLREIVKRAGLAPLPGTIFDRMPTSDNMYIAARRS